MGGGDVRRPPPLDRITVLLDANNSQVDGPVDAITTIEPIADKWTAFGWHAIDLDGHDVDAVRSALSRRSRRPRPQVVICRTSTVTAWTACRPTPTGTSSSCPELAAAAVAELARKLETRWS